MTLHTYFFDYGRHVEEVDVQLDPGEEMPHPRTVAEKTGLSDQWDACIVQGDVEDLVFTNQETA